MCLRVTAPPRKQGIHPLTQSDYKDVCAIFKESFDISEFPLKELDKVWAQRVEETCGWFDTHGKLAGFAIVIPKHKTLKYLYFFGVYVHVRGQGVGTAILRHILEKVPSIYLWPISDRLKAWYMSHGFYPTGSGGDYYAFHKYNTRLKRKCLTAPRPPCPLSPPCL